MDLTDPQGVVVAGSPETAAAGIEMLCRGGNAVDAAVAAAFATFVAESTISHTGGSGFALVYQPGAEPLLYDFFSVMPGLGGNGTIDRERLDFREAFLEYAATVDAYHIGRGSAAVPGNVAGLCALAEDYGQLSLSALLAPAIRLAREGVLVSSSQASMGALIKPIITATPAIARLFSPNGHLIEAGDRLRNPDLATTLERLAVEGPALFYSGDVATAIVADQVAHGGLVTADDLAHYHILRRSPLRLSYRGVTILTNPPPSSGGALIAFSLRLLEGFQVGRLAHGSATHLALLTEVMRATNRARAARDPAQLVAPADLDDFMSEAHVTPYRQQVVDALSSGRPEEDLLGETRTRGSTTHISVIDGRGMAVGLTTTPGESAGFLVGATGVILNNLLGEADLHPRGFHALPPGAHLSSMMAPTVLLDGGHPRAVLGSGGSNRLRTAILQTISNLVDFGLSVTEAVNRPRMHFEGRMIELEGGFDPVAADGLERAGYRVNRWPGKNMFFGGVHTAVVEDGGLGGTGDPRRGGAVEVLSSDVPQALQ
jgi:gamma-glutamyltranspeptidase/glutathione hydrolase